MSSSYLSIDPAYLAQQYTQIERAAKDESLATKNRLYSNQISAFNDLKSLMTDFLSGLEDSQDEGGILSNQASNNNEAALSITADSSAVAGSYDIFVEQLAQSHQVALSFDPDAVLPVDGEFSIDLGGEEFVVDLSSLSAGATVKDLAAAINNHGDNTGVKATLMRSGTETFLVLTSEESGAVNQLSLNFTGGADPAGAFISSALSGMQVLTQAQDAIVKLGASSPVTITSASNQLDDVIEGVTIELKQAQEAGDASVKVSVGQDLSTSQDNIKSFVDELNAIVSKIEDNKNLDNDPMAKSLVRQLKAAFQGTTEGKTFYSVGIEFDKNGKLSIDTTRLEKTLLEQPEQLEAMLSGENGVMSKLQDTLQPYTSSYGIMTKKTQTLQASLDLVIDRQERHEYSMEQVYSRYLSQFTQMQVTIAQLESSMGQFA